MSGGGGAVVRETAIVAVHGEVTSVMHTAAVQQYAYSHEFGGDFNS